MRTDNCDGNNGNNHGLSAHGHGCPHDRSVSPDRHPATSEPTRSLARSVDRPMKATARDVGQISLARAHSPNSQVTRTHPCMAMPSHTDDVDGRDVSAQPFDDDTTVIMANVLDGTGRGANSKLNSNASPWYPASCVPTINWGDTSWGGQSTSLPSTQATEDSFESWMDHIDAQAFARSPAKFNEKSLACAYRT